jgi:osmotically-inducible protein OsmY
MPPDMAAPPPKEISNTAIELRIRKAFANEERLISKNVNVLVTDDHVVLEGDVSDVQTKQRVNQLADKFAGGRKVIDNMRVRNQQ